MIFALLAIAATLGSQGCTEKKWPVLKEYTGEFLDRIKMPLGGIGTGTISLSGRGGLVDWELQNRPAKGFTPTTGYWPPIVQPSFCIRYKVVEQPPRGLLLEGPLSRFDYEGDMGSRAQNCGFPRFSNVVFKAAYPLAQVDYLDPSVPIDVRLEAMNPLVPGDARSSGIPAILLRWRIRNKANGPAAVSVCGTMVNFAGIEPTPNQVCNESDVERKCVSFSSSGIRGVNLSGANKKNQCQDGSARVDYRDGEFALMVPEHAAKITTVAGLQDPGWGCAMDRWWKKFVECGCISACMEDSVRTIRDLPVAQVCAEINLQPGETKTIPFVLSWRFPNRHAWSWDRQEPSEKTCVGNWYATEWPDAFAAGKELLTGLPSLEKKTVTFVESVLRRNAPQVVKEAALFNLSTLRTETCFRTADGHFYGWEGCADAEGSCYGNCTHVWGYEHALVSLWPELARSMLDNEFGVQLAANGRMRFRVRLPLATNSGDDGVACADGQMQCIIKAYEYWKKTGDREWLLRNWPNIRRAMSFCWIDGGWDADEDGVMEGCQHNTMDVEYYGPNPQMGFLYLTALAAISNMAQECGDKDFSMRCRALQMKGSAWIEEHLFNGSYYEQEIRPPKDKIAAGLRDPIMGAKDLRNPDFQLGAGCLIDQLLGDYSACAVGLPPVADARHSEQALVTVLKRCRRASNEVVFNPMRSYVLLDEASLTMAWYPANRFPRSPFPYYRESMPGFEYVVAALLAWKGDRSAAELVVRDIRERYDGQKRNPFDEVECGHHYIRSLASWTVLNAFDDGGEMSMIDEKRQECVFPKVGNL